MENYQSALIIKNGKVAVTVKIIGLWKSQTQYLTFSHFPDRRDNVRAALLYCQGCKIPLFRV